jgi:hypothetical protein
MRASSIEPLFGRGPASAGAHYPHIARLSDGVVQRVLLVPPLLRGDVRQEGGRVSLGPVFGRYRRVDVNADAVDAQRPIKGILAVLEVGQKRDPADIRWAEEEDPRVPALQSRQLGGRNGIEAGIFKSPGSQVQVAKLGRRSSAIRYERILLQAFCNRHGGEVTNAASQAVFGSWRAAALVPGHEERVLDVGREGGRWALPAVQFGVEDIKGVEGMFGAGGLTLCGHFCVTHAQEAAAVRTQGTSQRTTWASSAHHQNVRSRPMPRLRPYKAQLHDQRYCQGD